MAAATGAKLHLERFEVMEIDFSLSKKEGINMSTRKVKCKMNPIVLITLGHIGVKLKF